MTISLHSRGFLIEVHEPPGVGGGDSRDVSVVCGLVSDSVLKTGVFHCNDIAV